jgi:hypothetical protein
MEAKQHMHRNGQRGFRASSIYCIVHVDATTNLSLGGDMQGLRGEYPVACVAGISHMQAAPATRRVLAACMLLIAVKMSESSARYTDIPCICGGGDRRQCKSRPDVT